ncbi:MAG: hypothetical protein M3N13_06780 [Candidatus Eremiobacteraeota bacterium]|nr:hypothetical protein [Candidatus Eremiobacteraeota bacterium]
MSGIALKIAIVVVVLAEIAFPGRSIYYVGWINVAIAAAVVICIAQLNGLMKRLPSARSRAGAVISTFGVAVVGISGIVNGLLAPAPETVVGAPGSSLRVESLNRTLDFPEMGDVRFPFAPLEGSLLLRPVPRTVVRVEAFDLHGGPLTITQPSGEVFLSPVLLMQSMQNISGMNLPYDSFAVPATHRLVKAVLFSAQEAAQLRGVSGLPGPAVLFDVEDENARSVRNGLAIARSGQMVSVAGLQLRPTVADYPAIRASTIPNVLAVSIGLAAVALGAALAGIKSPSR